MQLHALLAATAFFSRAGLAQVVGSATGFATGVTGGGSSAPVTPADIDELVSYLTDAEARVILIDKTFDFVGSEGTVNATGCRPDSNTCPGKGGQDAINEANWCSSSYPSVPVTYSKAALEGIHVASDKSIVGVGDKGVIKGRGFRLVNDVSNIIIQNIHITDLNPEYIWGGDAITLAGCDNVWIDHVKFSLIGRQMIVTGYDAAGRVTISNSEFDGTTTNSATCNNNHYWTMLFYGDADKITLQNNYIHDVSGRAPKVGGSGTITMHSVNNLFSNNGGNDFEVGKGASILIEGNVFNKVDTPFTAGSSTEGGTIFNVPDSSSASTCSSSIKRECLVNTVTDSGDFPSFTDTTILDTLSSVDNLVEPMAVSKVESYVIANAGVGKLSSSGSTSSVAPSPSSTASSRRRSHRRHSHARN